MDDTEYENDFTTPFEVIPGYAGQTQFSPQVPSGFIGIRIAAPKEAPFPAAGAEFEVRGLTYVPVSMTFRFSLLFESQFDFMIHHMTAVAVDSATGRALSGRLKEEDPIDPPSPEPFRGPKERLERTFSKGHITFNLCEFVDLPAAEATYHVHVTLKDYQSNVVTIRIRKRE